jgi:thioredoxin 1
MFKQLFQAIGLRAKRPAAMPAKQTDQVAPIEVTDGDFATLVLGSPTFAVVDCGAEWCQPCQIMSAYMGFLATEYAGQVLVAALDVDANPETTARYEIMGLPTVLFFQDGLEVGRQLGVVSYPELRQQVEHWLNSDLDMD